MKDLITCAIVVFFVFTTGCSVYMAANQPENKDLTVLNKGTDRTRVIAECGIPVHTEIRDGNKVDVYSFVQGYSKGAKTGRALFHGAADVVTLGLWEVVGTPVESIADGTDVKVEVCYDQDNKVNFIKVLKGEECFKEVNSIILPNADTN